MSTQNKLEQASALVAQPVVKKPWFFKLFRRLSVCCEVTTAVSKIVDVLFLVVAFEPIRRIFEHLTTT
jgi:hypothetical protein